MSQFLAFFKISWQSALAYRAESFIWLIVDSSSTFFLLAIWNSMEQAGRLTHDQASQLALYYILALIISQATGNHFEHDLIDEIKDGNISKSLLKPFSLRNFYMASEISWRILSTIYLFPSLLFTLPMLKNLTGITINYLSVVVAIIIVGIAFLQRFFISWLISAAAFWFEQSKALSHFKWMLEGTFGGQWLPLYFFPVWFQSIAKWTPFYSWYFLPIELITGNLPLSAIIPDVIASLFWAIGLWQFSNFIWTRALYKYSAVGG